MKLLAAVLSGLALASLVLAREPGFREYRAVRESLQSVHPRFAPRWLKDHGYDPADFMPRPWAGSDSLGLELKGKWGRGRSVEVTGQDSLVFLSLGSEIAILSVADPAQPRILTELQLGFCPTQTYVADSLLVTGGYSCIETWNISDIAHPLFLGRIPCSVGDFCARDSFLYFVSEGSFRVYSIGDPVAPYELGACADSGWATTVAGNTVVLVLSDGYGFMDVSNPHAPVRVGAYGGNSISATARGTICLVSNDDDGSPPAADFEVLDISNPASPRRLAMLDSAGGYDMSLKGSLAYMSGWQEGLGQFCVVDISDSAAPVRLGTCPTTGSGFGVWASPLSSVAFLASDERGLQVVDVSNPSLPVFDTSMMRADYALDVCVVSDQAYVADSRAQLRILDVTNPAAPVELGGLDTLSNDSYAVAASDSFAYISSMQPPWMRTISVADPTHPVKAGGGAAETVPEDMVLHDTLLYLAGHLRFNVVSVARPRQPVLVGSCVLQNDIADLWLRDSTAYVSSYPSYIINVADPASPVIVGNISSGTNGIAVIRDTYAIATPDFDSIVVYNVSIPSTPNPVASLVLSGGHQYVDDIELMDDDTLAAVSGDYVHLVNVRDPLRPREVCRWTPPSSYAPRLAYRAPCLYVACYEAGVCVLETTATGVEEPAPASNPHPAIQVAPSVTGGRVRMTVSSSNGTYDLRLYDIAGKEVMGAALGPDWSRAGSVLTVDLAGLPAGVYVFRGIVERQAITAKVVKH